MIMSKILGNLLTSKGPLHNSFYVVRRHISNPYFYLIGNREIVGYGSNSMPTYFDSVSFPFPAVRFKESTAPIIALQEKEKGDWRKMSIEEKRRLYRSSFCQTFAEIEAPTGQWASQIGSALIFISLGLWLFMFMRWINPIELPDSFTEKYKQAQLKRMITLQVNPIQGVSSKWDYVKKTWKK